MRAARFLLAALAPLCSGCSILIARSGKDVTELTTKEQVRRDLGQPTVSGIDEGRCYDEYHTHRKLAEPFQADLNSMALGYTFCLGEFILFPKEAFRLAETLLIGRDIRFYYDACGRVRGHTLDGRWTDFRLVPPADVNVETVPPEPADATANRSGPAQGRPSSSDD